MLWCLLLLLLFVVEGFGQQLYSLCIYWLISVMCINSLRILILAVATWLSLDTRRNLVVMKPLHPPQSHAELDFYILSYPAPRATIYVTMCEAHPSGILC